MERFYGPSETVKLTNGGGEALLQILIQYALLEPESKVRDQWISFLEARLIHGGLGCKAFSLNPPDEEIASIEMLQFLETVLGKAKKSVEDQTAISSVSFYIDDDDLTKKWVWILHTLVEQSAIARLRYF